MMVRKQILNEVARAIELREIVTSLGPAYIKLGQALSIRPDILSTAAMTELQKLCSVTGFLASLAFVTLKVAGKGASLFLGTVTLSEFLHLVAALGGCLGWYYARTYPAYLFRHRIPVSGSKVPTAEGVLSLPVGLDQSECLILAPARWWESSVGVGGR
ncbi:hypothetical protein L1887_35384 [Cichorium endivia]|nr:hypothetical protein L1887_35384 [Cichorium endivia]